MTNPPSDFLEQLTSLAVREGWRVTTDSAAHLWAERRLDGNVVQAFLVNPFDASIPDSESLRAVANVWTFVVFEDIEQRISSILTDAGVDSHITDRRTARFPLSELVRDGDPDCLMGYVLKFDASVSEQAKDFWAFYWSRATEHLERLGTSEILAEADYIPPFTTRIAWSTRQMLWHALRGAFSKAIDIGFAVERTAKVDLLASVRALQSSAAEKGHEFRPGRDALDHKKHPLWREFVAVREHVARLC